MSSKLTILSALSNKRIVFERYGEKDIVVGLYDGSWLIAEPILRSWLIWYILLHPRIKDETGASFDFPRVLDDMNEPFEPIHITNFDIRRALEWLKETIDHG